MLTRGPRIQNTTQDFHMFRVANQTLESCCLSLHFCHTDLRLACVGRHNSSTHLPTLILTRWVLIVDPALEDVDSLFSDFFIFGLDLFKVQDDTRGRNL